MKKLKEISEQIRESIAQFVEATDGAEPVLDKTVIDIKKRIAEAKELVAAAIAEEQRLERIYQEAVDTAEVWAKKADDALENEDIAAVREARQRKQEEMQRVNDYEHQILTQQAVVTSLKTVLNEFYQRFQNIVKRAETLHHSQKQAETRVELHKLLAEIEPSVSNAVEQAERRLKKTEAAAEFWEKQNRQTETQPKTNGDVSNLDQELAKLKKDILGSKEK